MIPIYRQKDIKAFDARLSERGLLDAAIARAGYSVFVLAREMLGRLYGKRVILIYGPGNNGRDGLVALEHLRMGGASVKKVSYACEDYFVRETYLGADLVIDGCFGMGLSRPFDLPPVPSGMPVLSIDVPSGLEGDSGIQLGSAVSAKATLCLSGLKLGTILEEGPDLCGQVYVSDLDLGEIGEPTSSEFLIVDSDLLDFTALRKRNDHKWRHSVAVIAGSKGMDGAARLVSMAAYFNGAGIVHLFTGPGLLGGSFGTETVVRHSQFDHLDLAEKEEFFRELAKRFKSFVIGPGLGRTNDTLEIVHAALKSGIPLVLDADAISVIPSLEWLVERSVETPGPIVMTPHDGELEALLGRSGPAFTGSYSKMDRSAFARWFSQKTGVTLLLKGGPTVVSSPSGTSYITSAPTASLAVAGSGDVLSGMIGATLSYEIDPTYGTALTAHLHGLAGRSMGRGLSGELCKISRNIFLRVQKLEEPRSPVTFFRPKPLEGVLVARPELLGDHIHPLV